MLKLKKDDIRSDSPSALRDNVAQGAFNVMPIKSVTNVLLLEDDDFDAAIISELLEQRSQRSYEVTRVCSLAEAKAVITPNRFHIILSDMGLPDSSGLTTIREILNASQKTPVVVLTGNEDTAVALQAMRLGAQDYLPKSQINDKVLERITEYAIHRTLLQSEQKTNPDTDTLTGLVNRTTLYDRWQRVHARSVRDNTKIGVLLVDINKFTALNKSLGHEAGDALLAHIALELQGSVHATDLVARLSNDEFIVILENLITQKDLNAIRDKLQLLLSDSFNHNGMRIDYSVAIGAALCSSKSDADLISVIKRAEGRVAALKAKLTAVA